MERSRLQQTVLSRIFSGEGVIVSVVHDYHHALQRLADEKIDIVCTAYQLEADKSGVDLATEIRKIKKYRDIPIMLMASNIKHLSTLDAYNAGVTEIFDRSNFEELSNNIQSLLNRRVCSINAHILYIEDSKTAAILTMRDLEACNMTFDHYISADEAIIAYKNNQDIYDMVITDVVVEGKLDGLGFVRELRKITPENYKMPVLAVSGLDDVSRRVELLRSGANDYIVKPYVKDELLVRVKNLITTKNLFDQVEIQQDLLYKQAMQDHLTGLYNRHAMETLLPKFCSSAIRHQKPIGILFFDIDHFKQVNDTHGHLVGDNVLIQMGKLILSNFRSEDFSARYGGEEFIVILYDTDYEQTLTIAEKFRKNIEFHDFSDIKITISIGAINTFLNENSDINELFKVADKILYEAKESGRNKVCSFDLTNRAN
ncbi:diguanylate cyclase [sulfur-oxidizing endosymbiont of Gigantopelta aegis]|uniref:diguanylate cyclase n=1 Tax=sulfur-oxidizing endosymbiont of Gigantopelta aegis TaxID=2794934 RepID=UPI0018DDC64E|nr:diguanylate cyclase [sulfur-oxidizing endosymbiont of Gigantopelta aegis]